jgi:hypothetical protein
MMATPQRQRAPRKPPAPKPPPRRRVYPGGRPMGAPRTSTGREVTPRQVASAPLRGAEAVTQRKAYTARHMLTAELLIGVGIVAIRAVADYEPQADGTLKGKVGHPKGQYGPLPILAGLVITFFLLSFLAASGGTKAKLAVVGGGIIDLALLMKSSAEFVKVAGTFSDFGKAKTPPGAWQTEGDISGQPISGTASGGAGGGSPAGTGPSTGKLPTGVIPLPASGNCPTGYFRAVIGKRVVCFPGAIQG